MATYEVLVPFTGKMVVRVEAADEDSAIEQAIDLATLDDLEEWEAHRQIVQGNVFYGNLNVAEAEKVED